MFDGIETDRAAVDDRFLIRQLNVSTPFSTTNGEVRYDQRLPATNYKGLRITGLPRTNEPGRYWFPIRGSLIGAANNGHHNNDFKDPIEILYALDDLITRLHINPFKTPLNGLELSATIQVANPQQICSSIVSYINRRPNLSTINRDGLQLPYAEVEAKQHKLKLYAPVTGALRVELKIDKMQYLKPAYPQTFADLVQPAYADPLIAKLTTAFNKIVWKYPGLDLNSLTPADRDLYLQGRTHEHWQVGRKDYATLTEFRRVEKQREREKVKYNGIVQRHWISQPPVELERRLCDQLNRYRDLMHTSIYQTLLDICLNRWEYVGNLPSAHKLPNYLTLPTLSEIYPLYFGKFPTTLNNAQLSLNKRWVSANDQRGQPEKTADLLQGYKPRRSKSNRPAQTDEERAWKRQRNQASNSPNNELRRMAKKINDPNGLLCSLDELSSMLSAKTRIALAYSGKSLSSLLCQHLDRPKPVPLFPD